MLQVDQSKAAPREPESEHSDLVSFGRLYDTFLRLVRRQSAIILFIVLVTLGLASVYVFTAIPRYTARAVLLIDSPKLNLFQQQSSQDDVNLPLDTAMVDSQVEILKSENIALSVIKDLHLTDDPEFVGPAGGLIGGLFGLLSNFGGGSEAKSEYALSREALQRFQKRLTVKRVGLTYVINIDFESLNPQRAAQIANAIADAYVVDTLEAKYDSTKRAAVWLQDRLNELRAQATAADRKVVAFKEKNNIVDTGGRLLNEQQLAELNSALVLARAQTAEAQAKYARVNQILQAESQAKDQSDDKGDVFDQATATVTDSLHDDVITRLRQQYLDLAARESDWAMRYGPTHLAVVNLKNQMQEIRNSIDDELHRIAQTYKSDYDIAKSREDSIQKSLNDIVSQSNQTHQAEITLRDLDSTAQSYRALADNFLQQYMTSVQQQSFPITDSRLITKATPPLKPSHPKTLLILGLALAGGTFLSFGIAAVRDLSDQVFRTTSQVETSLALDCVAVVPRVKTPVAATMPMLEDPAQRTIMRDQSLIWYSLDAPFSRFSESIRSIKVAGDLFAMSRPNKVIGLTSSLPNEGKSTIAASLAQLMSDAGGRVILVDTDLRNPALSRQLAPNATMGLLEVISEKAALDDVIWVNPATNLQFLPAVVKSRLAHTSEIIASEATANLFRKLRETYDYVIVDLSPLAPIVDVRATINFIDSYLFVVEWGNTKIPVVQHALNNAREVKNNILGVVLNKADFRVLNRYETYRGDYYYNSHYYSRYGYTD
ncbi:MAG TPA: AAA family ATPase [Gemmataceae bacterium]|nr:AAA family ATPase [Gemmataceae bacterium]